MATIAFTGKGGVGKTTVAALTVQWLIQNGHTPLLAIDADSNANLHEVLGVTYAATVGGIREEARNAVKGDPSLSKSELLAMQIQRALVEEKGFDLLVMGRPEGPGCYCYANNVLRDAIARLSSSYRWVVVDCEAGLEHISRRTLLTLDWLVTVSDQSLRGVRTAVRISGLLDEMKTRVSHRAHLVNRTPAGRECPTPEQSALLKESGNEWAIGIPEDPAVTAMDERDGTISDIPAGSPVRIAIGSLMKRVGALQA